MAIATNLAKKIGWVVIILFFATTASAQLENQLSAYTGANASGYVGPLVDAFGADINAGLFHSARIPRWGLNISLEFRVMSVFFTDGNRRFLAVTEGDFRPETTAEAPTVVGDRKAVFVDGEGGTRFAFPGGFDLESFSIGVPQLRIGSLYGTELLFRYLFFSTGNSELGDFKLYGLGFRHSITQHFGPDIPIDMALSVFWQKLSLGENERGDDLLAADALAVGLQISKRVTRLEPYLGISYERSSIDVAYGGASTPGIIDFSFSSGDDIYLTLGLSLDIAFMVASGEYNLGDQNALSFGLAFHYHH